MKERLCLEVERLGLSAVIMGSRGFGAIKRGNSGRLGSVSNYCVRHCVCPVVVVRYPDEKDGGNAPQVSVAFAAEDEDDTEFHDASDDRKGHYVPQLAEQILHNNKNAPKDDYINLKGFIQNNYSAPHVPQNVNACPTLFVANLGPTCSEQELIQVFSSCHGFIKLKMQSTYGTPVAFVDFQDAACSSESLNHLQGTILYSSPPGEGMRLEYAKSRMGMRSKKSR